MKKPNSLFKYMKSNHANTFFRQGIIRIGTLHEYRDIEKHGKVVGDHQEGMLIEEELHENLTMQSAKDVPSFVRERIKISPGSKIQLINSTFSLSDQSPDYYMYCVTTEFDPTVMKEFGCDRCIEINNVQKFIDGLNHCMRHKGKFVGAFNCVYTEKVVSPGKKPPYPPVLVKDPKYENQKEVRFLWEPKNKYPRPERMACRKIPRHCSYVNNA